MTEWLLDPSSQSDKSFLIIAKFYIDILSIQSMFYANQIFYFKYITKIVLLHAYPLKFSKTVIK